MRVYSKPAGGSNRVLKQLAALIILAIVFYFIFANQLGAQTRAHRMHNANQLPGVVAFEQLMRRPEMNGYVQPYRFLVPEGVEVAVWKNGGFEKVESGKSIGLMVGRVYRLKMTNLPGQPATVFYPSVEIINRLYPPQGEADKHAVEVRFDKSDLDEVAKGNVVTRVVYLENPRLALAVTQRKGEQQWFDTAPGEDPLQTAEQYGRPMAIVRMGSRVPNVTDGMAFHFGQALVTHAEQAGCSSCCGCVACAPKDPRTSEDEFVCDGGDRNLKVVLQDNDKVEGLDSEDTIGHFSTQSGELHVAESNRVCIYSPRFAAIRKIWQAISTHSTERMARMNETTKPESFVEKDFATTTKQHVRVKQFRNTKSAVEFRDQTRGLTVDNTTQTHAFSNLYSLHENFQIMRIGKMRANEGAKLFRATQAARAWEDALAVQAVSKSINLVVTRDVQIVEVGTHIERPDNRPHLRIVKTASQKSARPGETVEFSIRFDNVGDEVIGDIAIMDNLTTRLKYIDGSAECSIPATFTMLPNASGSHTLKWTVNDPLKVNQGGLIRFKCEVR